VPHYKLTARGLVPHDPRLPAAAQPAKLPPLRSTARWQRAARRQIRREPWCAECGHKGDEANPLTADHVVALAAGGDPWSPANLQTLCRSCNSSKGTLC
jgi:5-methylcytosine-specific restriction endonuclease McrA